MKFYALIFLIPLKKINSIIKSFGEFRSLRDASPKLDKFEGSLAAYAIAISNWHKQNKFCNICGAKNIGFKCWPSNKLLKSIAPMFNFQEWIQL